MKRKATKIVELVIADDSEELTIDAISLVTSPAIEQDFVFFGKENNNLTFAKVDEEKRMLISPALIPNKQIFRYDPNTDSNYYVFFSKETVRKSSELYLEHNNHHKATYQHEDRVSGVLTVESWIIEDTKKDKSTLYGFSLPVGTWMVKLRIDNDEMWNKIKDGELKGLSIEGYFINKMEKMGKQQFSNEEIREAIKELLSGQKIDLGSVKELKEKSDKLLKALRDADKTWRNYQDYLTGADKPFVKMIDAYNELDPAVSFAEGTLKRFEKAAKELGVDATNNKNFKDLESYIKESKTVFNIINSFGDPSTFQK
jgi:hypothetical protein